MANRDYSDAHATQNPFDYTATEHRNDFHTAAAESAAPAEANSGPARPSNEADAVLELKRYRAQLRDHEKTLIDRIADVDDDRRASETRIQRAWQTRSEEVDARLRRHTITIAGLLIVFASALFLNYRLAANGQLETAAALSDLRNELAQSPAQVAIDTQARLKLERLGAEVQAIASSLRGLVEDGARTLPASPGEEHRVRPPSEGALGEALRTLSAEQRRLWEALEALQSAVLNLETAHAGTPAERADHTTDEGGLSVADASVLPAADRASAEPVADAGATHEPATDSGTEPARQAAHTRAPDARETLVAAEGNYALQLIGAFDRKSLERFVLQYGLTARAYSIRLSYEDRPWYVLIHSMHEGYSAAADALSRLPPDLAALEPWIRPLPAGAELQIIASGPDRQ